MNLEREQTLLIDLINTLITRGLAPDVTAENEKHNR